MQKVFAPLFISHGAPTMVIDNSIKTHYYLRELGPKVGKPKAIVVVSAHWESNPIEVTSSTKQIYDFYGFPQELYRLKYQPPEDEPLAHRIVDMLKNNSIDAKFNCDRGVDHGTWVPLALMFPDADIPVVQLSLKKGLDFPTHLKIGKALSPLIAEGYLLIGSGGSTHNLGRVSFNGDRSNQSEQWVHDFEDWLKETLELEDVSQRNKRIASVMTDHPLARLAHPREEHFLPLVVICGAAGRGKQEYVEFVFNFSTAQYQFEPVVQ